VSRRAVVNIVGTAISLLCLAWFIVKAQQEWRSASAGFAPEIVLPKVAVALIPVFLAYAAAATAWVLLMRCLGVRTGAAAGAGIYLTAQFAKYLPGNVGQYVGRVLLAARHGLSAPTVALSMTLEMIVLLAIAAIFSLPSIGLAAHKLQFAWHAFDPGRLRILLLAATVIAGAAIAFALLRWQLIARARRWAAEAMKSLTRPAALGWLCISVTLSVTALWLTGLSLLTLETTQLHFSQLVLMVSLYSASWIVGVLTPGVPAGLGVREAILVEGLTPILGPGQAVGSALLFRLLTTVADVATFAIGLLLLKVAAQRASPQTAD
jgi:glycosyltransferase 2 family protein